MIIDFFTFPNVSYKSYTVDVVDSFRCEYRQKVDYINVSSGKTLAYNYGSLADKWITEITIQGKTSAYDGSSRFEDLARDLTSDIDVVYVKLGDGEEIFGAGIDYTEYIKCNIITPKRKYSQENIALSRITLTLEAISYATETPSTDTQLVYKPSIPSGLPAKLNFQTPIDRNIIKRESAFQSENYGSYGMITEQVNSQTFNLVFDQTEAEMAQIEKFVSTQRSTPFIFSEADYVYLFENQDTENVMITGLIVTRTSHNHWRATLKLVNNV